MGPVDYIYVLPNAIHHHAQQVANSMYQLPWLGQLNHVSKSSSQAVRGREEEADAPVGMVLLLLCVTGWRKRI